MSSPLERPKYRGPVGHRICGKPDCRVSSKEIKFHYVGRKDKLGRDRLRAMCSVHDAKSRGNHNRNKGKAHKDLSTTHGGSSKSKQKVRP